MGQKESVGFFNNLLLNYRYGYVSPHVLGQIILGFITMCIYNLKIKFF